MSKFARGRIEDKVLRLCDTFELKRPMFGGGN